MSTNRIRARPNHHRWRRLVTGVVLSGGQGLRMGGRDKGLLKARGQPMVIWAVTQLRPHAALIMISINRHRSRYAQLADRVIVDGIPDHAGPLAGILAGLKAARTPLVVVCPCDVIALPPNVVQRLISALRLHGDANVAVVRDSVRRQPLLAAIRRRVTPQLANYMSAGGRSALGWLDTLRVHDVRISGHLQNQNTIPTWRRTIRRPED